MSLELIDTALLCSYNSYITQKEVSRCKLLAFVN
jgi:hypothetical protein